MPSGRVDSTFGQPPHPECHGYLGNGTPTDLVSPGRKSQNPPFGQSVNIMIMADQIKCNFYYMKQLIEIKLNNVQQRQDICLPHLRAKSLSIPSTRFHLNSMSRYDRKTGDNLMISHNKGRHDDRKWVAINLQEIEKKARVDQASKVQASTERKKIFSQYETIDLWKERYSPNQYILPRKPAKKHEHEPVSNNEDVEFEQRTVDQEKIFHLKKEKKHNTLQLKIMRKNDKEKSIPDEVVVHRIDQLQKLKNDEKLEAILKRQIRRDDNQVKRNYKSSLPVFQKIVSFPSHAERKQEVNPTKWEIQKHYTEQQSDNF